MTNDEARELFQKACDAMNAAFAADPAAMYALSSFRFPCNLALVDHPNIVVDKLPVLQDAPVYAVGMIGVLTGVFHAMGFEFTVASNWSDKKDEESRPKFLGFRVVPTTPAAQYCELTQATH